MGKDIEKRKAFTILAEEINKKRLAIFIGAGCSVSAGLPTWKDLINDLLEKYHIKTLNADLLLLASKLERKISPLKLREEIADRLRTNPSNVTQLHNILASLDINLFITTNYDHLLEDAFRNHDLSPDIITNDRDLPSIDITRKTIVKLHGDIDSATSLIITSSDYRRYKTTHRGFIDHLIAFFSQKTVLFLGTSFDDPRLQDPDDHVLNLYDKDRRQPFILLKSPSPSPKNKDLYDIEVDDFHDLCEHFRERGFFVIPIDEYEEIQSFLKEIKEEAIRLGMKKNVTNFEYGRLIDRLSTAEKELTSLKDKKTLELCQNVRGHGRLPTLSMMKKHAEKLRQHLENNWQSLSTDARMEGCITLFDAFFISEENGHAAKTREYFEKAKATFDALPDKEKWLERLLRMRGKLLFYEGKIDEAIKEVSKSKDSKTLSLWLAFLLESGRMLEINDFIDLHKDTLHPSWFGKALYAYVYNNHFREAEKLFDQKIKELESAKKKSNLKGTPFKHESIYEEMCFAIADSLYRRAIYLTGKQKSEVMLLYPDDLTEEGKELCQKAFNYLDLLNDLLKREQIKLEDSFFSSLSVLLDIKVSSLVKNWKRADAAAEKLVLLRHTYKDAVKEAVFYIIDRHERQRNFTNDFLSRIISDLSEDHPTASWAWAFIAEIYVLLKAPQESYPEKAWQALQRAVNLAAKDGEKKSVADIAFTLGIKFDRLEESMRIINDILPTDDIWSKFIKARYSQIKKDNQKSRKLLKEIEAQNPPYYIEAQVKYAHALLSMDEEKWTEAKKFLDESYALVPAPNILKDYLYVVTKLQDTTAALKIAEDIESYEMEDWQVTHIKAQTAQNLGQYQKAEQAWRHLVEDFPKKPEFAYGLANVLILIDKNNSRNAIDVLKPFIQPNKRIHLPSLGLACEIYEISENHHAAFDLLDNCYKHIKDDPSLLIRHLDLGYRTGKEEKAEKSLVRLEILRQEGKIPEGMFMKVSFDQIVEELKNRRESIQKLNDQYRLGRLPRLMLCKQSNMSLYLDWVLRTQELKALPSNPVGLIDFTIYSTNGMRVDRDKKGRNRLVPITAPAGQKKIVIDYHALITLHRLDLLKKLETYYEKIYYPSSLKILLLHEQRRFAPQQLARENTYKKLQERIDTNEIRVFLAPDPAESDLEQGDSPLRRDLRLAQLRKFPYLSNYVEEKELTDFSDVKVFRLPQVIAWLYSGGNLAWSKYSELLKLAVGRPEVVKEKVNHILDNAAQLLIDETTLVFMEQYDLVQPILRRGTQIVIEKNTADSLQYAVLGTNLKEKVKKWHQELTNFLEGSEVFEESRHYYHFKEHNLSQDPYLESSLSALSIAEETDNFLLTDDRWSQMIRIKEFKNKQFGTDALLAALHKEEKITIEDYARCFLQLLQWRYRFLLPDVDVLVYLAKEYKERPLGIHLSTIADYGQKCMEDIGLFLGPEQTEPPLPLGIKYHMEWITRWIDFLVRIWQDNNFTNENRRRITQKVYNQALPGAPKGIREEFRSNYATANNDNILTHLFRQTMKVETNPVQLYGLFMITFDRLGYDEQRRIAALRAYLEFIKESLRNDKDRDIISIFIIRAIEAFYEKKRSEINIKIFDISLIPILKEFSLIVKKGLAPVQMEKIKSKEAREYTKEYTENELLDIMGNPEYVRKGPLVIVPPTEEKLGVILVPHELIHRQAVKLREGGVKDLLKLEDAYISPITRELIRQKSEDISSGALKIWLSAAGETSEALLKDFFYTRSLFLQAFELPVRRQELVKIAWKHVLTPDLDTILSKMPLLICEPVTAESIWAKLEDDLSPKKERDKLNQKTDSVDIQKTNAGYMPEITLKKALNWYLENIYFIPVTSFLSPWQIIIKQMEKRGRQIDKSGPSNETIFQIVLEWIKEQEDPFAYLIALEIILNARCAEKLNKGIKEKEKLSVLNEENFDALLKQIFNVIFITEEFGDTEKTQDLAFRKFQVIWRMRRALAHYFLKYIDLNNKGKLKDEKRVVLAWWLARQVESSILKGSSKLANLQEEQIAWIEAGIQFIKEKERFISITHIFEDRKGAYLNPRYCTFHTKTLLSSAALSILTPPEDHDINICLPFNGLKFPTPILPPQVPERMIYKMQISLIWGEGQMPKVNKREFPWLWNKPLCNSVPVFLEGYYDAALKYFGKAKISLLLGAKEVAEPDFLTKSLEDIPQIVKTKHSRMVAIILSSLKVFVFTHAEMPESAKVFEENTMLAKTLSQLDDDDAADISLIALVGILMRLRTTGNNKWAEIIEKQFYSIDYVKCSQAIVDSVIPELSVAVLLGADYSIFQPIIKRKGADTRIRSILGSIKEQIEQVFPHIPDAYKENARKILNDLDDIPIPEEKEEASKE